MIGSPRRSRNWPFTVSVALVSMVVGGMFAAMLTLILVGSDNEDNNRGPAQPTGQIIFPLVFESDEPSAVVNAESLNVRTGPGTDTGVIQILPYGQVVHMLGRDAEGSWVMIYLSDFLSGWVRTEYLSTSASISRLQVVDDAPTVLVPGNPSPHISISPGTSQAGFPVAVQVGGFPPDVQVNLYLGKSIASTPSELYATGYTENSGGSAILSFTMPESWSDGSCIDSSRLVAMVSTADGTYYAWAEFGYIPPNTGLCSN